MPGYLVPQISSASSIGFTPSGNISASTLQAALQELDTEKFVNDWGSKSGPTSLSSAYKAVWGLQAGISKSIDHTTYNYGLLIKETGFYEVKAAQRGATSGAMIGIGLNGDRSALETRSGATWSHDHSPGVGKWTESYYIGPLNINEIITAGSPAAADVSYGANGYNGFLVIKRIG
jgi:hypothetical protein